MAMKTVADLTNKSIAQRDVESAHPLEQAVETRVAEDAGALKSQSDVSWEHLSEEQLSAATVKVDVYLEDFISIVQGGTKERRQMLRHLFYQIDRIFRPNTAADTDRKYPISRNNLGQGDGAWSTWGKVLG